MHYMRCCCASCEKTKQNKKNTETNPLLRPKFPISHQVYFIGEVHGHSQLDQEINAESITTLGYYWASCNKTRNN